MHLHMLDQGISMADEYGANCVLKNGWKRQQGL